jgi:tRNA (adenine57-N1/adenine58-N1)-methyltransferase catalytic subunit
VYTPDTAFILAKLCVLPGTICLEAGTGSGSFTHALARQVAPTGKVYTFEFHEQRHKMNIAEFTTHGLNEIVYGQHRDVCAQSFNIQNADCAFLDLPSPWEAIPHLPQAFNRNKVGRVCCFSPCIEQVLSTLSALRKYGFTNLTMYDLQYRTYEARPVQVRSIEEAMEKLSKLQKRVKERLPKEPRQSVKKRKPEEGDGLNWVNVAKGEYEVQTHTSFLTFGELMPEVGGSTELDQTGEEKTMAKEMVVEVNSAL